MPTTLKNRPAVFNQTQAFRALTMEQRLRMAQDFYSAAREWKTCALRSLHPEWSEASVRAAVTRSFSRAGT